MARLPLLGFASGLVLSLIACEGEVGPAAAVVASAKKAAAVVDAAPAAETTGAVVRYTYQPIGKRDPFRSFLSLAGPQAAVDGPVGPLQEHEIDQYKLRGIVWNIDAPKGLVEDPQGTGHVVEIGTLIGKNWGKITQIKPEELIITEEYRDPIENELIVHEVTMRLPNLDDDKVGKKK